MIIQLIKWWNDKPDQCPQCEGHGYCESCEGDGVFIHHGYEYACQMCDETGNCPYCEGEGTWAAYDRVRGLERQKELLEKRYGTIKPTSIRDFWVS